MIETRLPPPAVKFTTPLKTHDLPPLENGSRIGLGQRLDPFLDLVADLQACVFFFFLANPPSSPFWPGQIPGPFYINARDDPAPSLSDPYPPRRKDPFSLQSSLFYSRSRQAGIEMEAETIRSALICFSVSFSPPTGCPLFIVLCPFLGEDRQEFVRVSFFMFLLPLSMRVV